MAKAKPRPYFAQTNLGPNHRAQYFDTIESAREWLGRHGGGTIKKRLKNYPFWPIVEHVGSRGQVIGQLWASNYPGPS